MNTTTRTGPVANFTYTLRPVREDDFPAYVDFLNECAVLEPAVESISLDEASNWFHDPNNNDHDTLAFLTNADGSEGRIVATTVLGYKPGFPHAQGWMHVHPDYRLKGLGRALYNETVRQAEEQAASALMFTPSEHATLLIDFLGRRGYEIERYFWDMQLPANQPVEANTLPEGFTIRTFVHDQDEELLTHVRNVTFADHYGSVQRTVEEMTYRTKEPHFRAEGVFFAFEGGQIAGFCLTSMDPRECERRSESVGHIQLLGVMPAYRGRGLGRALLLAGVNYLRHDVSLVELGVEGKNDTALALYESVGFHRHKGWANMAARSA